MKLVLTLSLALLVAVSVWAAPALAGDGPWSRAVFYVA